MIFFSFTILVLIISRVVFGVVNLDTFNVKNFGAVGDGITIDTKAIVSAFSAAEKAGGGVVMFPSGGNFLSGAFNMTSNCELRVEKGASILGVKDKSHYPIIAPLPSYGKSRDVGHSRYQPLVFGAHLKNIKITGEGIIDGQGSYWWDLFEKKQLEHGRPRLVEFLWTKDIEIKEITLQNSGFWTLHPVYSQNIWIHDMVILAPAGAPNTDGIDPDSSQDILIENCTIDCGDDVIAIKSGMDDPGISYGWPTKNVTIRNCNFINGHGISIGSETSGGISDIFIHDCKILANSSSPIKHGLNIKTCRGRGGVIENISFKRISIGVAKEVVIAINMKYSSRGPTHNKTTTPIVRNVHYSDIEGTSLQKHGEFVCLEESECHGIVLERITTHGVEDYKCDYAYGKQSETDPEIKCLIPE